MRTLAVLLLSCITVFSTIAQKKKNDYSKIAETQVIKSFAEFREMLSLANDAHYPEQVEGVPRIALINSEMISSGKVLIQFSENLQYLRENIHKNLAIRL